MSFDEKAYSQVNLITWICIDWRKTLMKFLSTEQKNKLHNFKTGHILITTTVKWLKYCRYGENLNQSINQSSSTTYLETLNYTS